MPEAPCLPKEADRMVMPLPRESHGQRTEPEEAGSFDTLNFQ